MATAFPLPHSGHDYALLLERWRKLAESCGLGVQEFGRDPQGPVLAISSPPVHAGHPAIYLSAGVHGDECAPVWALLQWAETLGEKIRERPFFLLPCLNPYGLVENRRVNEADIDLNRKFQDGSIPVIGAWQSWIAGRSFSRCLVLHEDYDAVGIYVYEVSDSISVAENVLRAAETVIPRDLSEQIDGNEFSRGIAQRGDLDYGEIVEHHLGGGYPEALYLFLEMGAPSLTFETPSEMALDVRIAAHRRAIEAFVE